MSARYLPSLMLLVWLCACSSPPNPAVQALHTPPKEDTARVVILYPAPIMGSNGMVQVKWNGKGTCDLASGSFVVREITPGSEDLALSFCGVRGSSGFTLKAQGGHVYYLRALPYDSSLRGIVSGYPSEFDDKMNSVIPTKGPLRIESIPEEEALKALEPLTPAPHS